MNRKPIHFLAIRVGRVQFVGTGAGVIVMGLLLALIVLTRL